MRPDVFVIGGGPAGIAAAIAVRRKGMRVVVADSRQPPIDKACGEGLMPDTVVAAGQLGIELPARSFIFRGVRFSGEGTSVDSPFPSMHGLGVRRTVLHGALVEQAASAGVEFHWGSPVASLDGVRAGWIIGADGASSRVRQWAGLGAVSRDSRRFGFRAHYKRSPWTDLLEIYWGEGCQIYVTPVADDEISVATISRDPKQRVDDALQHFPELRSRFEGVGYSSLERGSVTASRKLRRVARGNVALIGDASGSVDAITGEGLSLSFRQAVALADALARGSLRSYAAEHRRLGRRPRFMAEFMLTLDRWAWLRRRVLPAMAGNPKLFGGLLAMHVGEATTPAFAMDCMALGWRALLA